MRMSRLQGLLGTTAKEFLLTISQGAYTTISVSRTASPAGHGSIGTLSNGDVIYQRDTLSITISANSGYYINAHTVNGSTWTSGTIVVNENISVVSTAFYKLLNYSSSVTWTASAWSKQAESTDNPRSAPALSGTTTRTVQARQGADWREGVAQCGAHDLTNFHTLRITVSSYSGSHQKYTIAVFKVSNGTMSSIKETQLTKAGTFSVDVSGLSGNYYIGVWYQTYCSNTTEALKFTTVELR